jgi:A/G-specific adenine glycosylase
VIEKQLKKWFSKHLLDWHESVNNRSMPWKGIKDPYRIWLSEIILQQTRVQQGMAYYQRFTEKYPDVHSLAAANETDVFKLWEGLGYYSRCRNLIITAKTVSTTLNGQFPRSEEGLLTLKGIGKYTAAAIGSFAFGLPLAVVDGNVVRVLARFLGIHDPVDQPAVKKKFELHAAEMLGKADPALYNQAIMDLGATVCKPGRPNCDACPLSNKCHAFLHAEQDRLPVKQKKIRIRNRFLYYLVLSAGAFVAIRQRTGRDIWQHLHEFILMEKDESMDQSDFNKLSNWGIQVKGEKLVAISEIYTHQLTHQKITSQFVHIRVENKIPIEGYHWVSKNKMKTLAFPRMISRYLDSHFL